MMRETENPRSRPIVGNQEPSGPTSDAHNEPDESELSDATALAGRDNEDKLHEIDPECTLAPIEHEDEVVPGAYFITFKPGHSMEKHFAYIGQDLYGQPHRASGSAFGYAISHLLDEELLLSIRRDPGVLRLWPSPPAYDDADDEDEDVDWDDAIHNSGKS